MNEEQKIVRLERTIEKLRQELVTDELTKILNRRGLMEMLTVLTREVGYQLKNPEKRRNLIIRHFSVIFIDIDHFKKVNTEFGHAGGDEVLVAVAQTIKKRLRGIDVVGRYGGEEIVAGLVGADHESAKIIAEDIRRSVEEAKVSSNGAEISVTISAGVATLQPDEDLEKLLERADSALYEAKNSGRNRVGVS